MNIAVVTLVAGEDYSNAVRLATRSKRDYCAYQAYDLFVGDNAHVESSRPVAWSKIPVLIRTLPHYDFVFWSDADALISNYETRIEEFFSGFIKSRKDVILTIDSAGNVNTGNFLLRSNRSTLDMLEAVWQQVQFKDHIWWDNMALIHLLKTDRRIQGQTAVVPNRQLPFNSYPHHNDYVNGDFVIHFAGVHDLQRLEQLIAQHYKPFPVATRTAIS